jgi:hypothetical protein
VITNNTHAKTSIKQQNTLFNAKVGQSITIPCEIENRKQATVIWQYSKSRIPETLTIGYFNYRKDLRIRVKTNSTNEKFQSWSLEIRKLKIEDEGYYLCKVMAENESLKRVIYLRIEVDMTLQITSPIMLLKEAIVLFCNTSYSLKELGKLKGKNGENQNFMSISWFKNNIYLNESNSSSTYRIVHETKPTSSSKLTIHSFSVNDAGIYTCRFRSQNVSIHIGIQNGNK